MRLEAELGKFNKFGALTEEGSNPEGAEGTLLIVDRHLCRQRCNSLSGASDALSQGRQGWCFWLYSSWVQTKESRELYARCGLVVLPYLLG